MSIVIWNLLDFRKQMKYMYSCLKVIPCNHAHLWFAAKCFWIFTPIIIFSSHSITKWIPLPPTQNKQTTLGWRTKKKERNSVFQACLDFGITHQGFWTCGNRAVSKPSWSQSPHFHPELPPVQLLRWRSWSGFANCDCFQDENKSSSWFNPVIWCWS